MSPRTASEAWSRGNASVAPLPSPSRICRSSKGSRPSASKTSRWPGSGERCAASIASTALGSSRAATSAAAAVMKPSRTTTRRSAAPPSASPTRKAISKPPSAARTPSGSAASTGFERRARVTTSTLRASPSSSTPVPRPQTGAGSPESRAADSAAAEVVLPMPISPSATMPTPSAESSPATVIPRSAQWSPSEDPSQDVLARVETQGPTGDDEHHLISSRGPERVHAAEQIAIAPADRSRRNNAEPDLVADRDREGATCGAVVRDGGGLLFHLRIGVAATEQIRHPQRDAIDHDRGVLLHCRERAAELERLLDRRPFRGPLSTVQPDPLGHLLVPGLARCEHRHRPVPPPREVDGER